MATLLWDQLRLDEFWFAALPPSREGTNWLAILKTLGFVRRQVSATVAWQATALGTVAVLIGLPLGVISGRWGWNVFADRLGVVPAVAVPTIGILLAVPVTILVANLLAAVPGRIASRLRPGPVLRSE